MPTIPKKNRKALAAPQGQPQLPAEPESLPADPNDFQDVLAYLAGDMIRHGGHQEDVNAFIRALAQHEYRKASGGSDLPGWMADRISKWLVFHQGGCVPRPGVDAAEASEATATATVRSNSLAALVSELEGFLKSATPEEVHLLTEILERRHAHYSGLSGMAPFAACPLAESFEATLARDGSRFVKVPRELQPAIAAQVRRYAEQHIARTFEPEAA